MCIMELDIPKFRNLLKWDGNPIKGENFMEQRMHLFALMMALYPITSNQALAEEFQMNAHTIELIAHNYGVYKSKEYTREKCITNGRDVYLKLYWTRKRREKDNHQ